MVCVPLTPARSADTRSAAGRTQTRAAAAAMPTAEPNRATSDGRAAGDLGGGAYEGVGTGAAMYQAFAKGSEGIRLPAKPLPRGWPLALTSC